MEHLQIQLANCLALEDLKETGLERKKNTSNNILNLVADYIFGYIKGMPSCNSNWEQVGNPYMILKADKLN